MKMEFLGVEVRLSMGHDFYLAYHDSKKIL